jgi:ectoine hydroxylase-related dioxygenase (phytanoyl-CoA dioxygenase family)
MEVTAEQHRGSTRSPRMRLSEQMNVRSELDLHGVAILDPALEAEVVNQLVRELAPLDGTLHASRRGGVRDVLRRVPGITRIMRHPAVSGVVRSTLGPGAFMVQGILFDSHPGASWKVPWHQDLTVAVQSRTEAAGYGPWSVKAGVMHVQPPIQVLERMLALRIHLDDSGEGNGALRVLPGSHRHGQVAGQSVRAALLRYPEVTCSVSRGGILAMRPLLVHASSSAETATQRRVLHLEFAASELASEVAWFERWNYAA